MHPSFQEIYQAHADMVYNLCLHYLHNTQDAEEVTQDVFVKVHRKLSEYRGEAGLKTWIYRITVNQCLDFLKARKRQKRFGFIVSIFGTSEEEMRHEVPDFNHPGVQLEDQEAVSAIMRCILKLPGKQQTALILKSIEGLPQQEIAAVMQLSEKAVESLLSRARASLKKKLDGNEG